jgi:hypothetical protein
MTTVKNNTLLDVLLHESAQVRDDDRYLFVQFTTLVTVALSLIVAMAWLFSQTCARGYPGCAEAGTATTPVWINVGGTAYPSCPGSGLTAVPVWMYIGGPLLPIALVAYAVLISSISTLRSYYMRVLERQIHRITDQSDAGLPMPSWAHVQLEVTGQAHSAGLARVNWYFIYVVILLLVALCLYSALLKIPETRLRIFAVAFDTILLAIPFAIGAGNVASGARLWKSSLKRLRERLDRTDSNFPADPQHSPERSLISFLVLPRNQEELLKALFTPLCFVIGLILVPRPSVASWGEFGDRFWYFVGFYVIFEFVIYQARYLYNDVRDREMDCGPLPKRRFPCSEKDNIAALTAAFVSFLVRLAIAALLVGTVLPVDNFRWVWHSAFLILVFLIAVPYEFARSKCNRVGSRRLRAWTLITLAAVGPGYALRSVVGLWLAGLDNAVALLLAAAGASLFGSTFVALAWALESTRVDTSDLRAGKAHLVLFRGAVSRALPSHTRIAPSSKVLIGRQSPLAWWCATAVLATAVIAAFTLCVLRDKLQVVTSVVCLFHRCLTVEVLPVAVAAMVALTAVAVSTPVQATIVLTLLNLCGFPVVLHLAGVPWVPSFVAALLAALPLGVTCAFRRMSYTDLPQFADKIWAVVRQGVLLVYFWFIRARR